MSIVYFARINHDGPIKIGFTTQNVASRVATLQVGCPWPIAVIGSLAGTVFHENWLHNHKFASLRMMGEWFRPEDELTSFIVDALAPGFIWPVAPPDNHITNPHARNFIADVDAFLDRSGMSATAFGRLALNDPSFVRTVRAGRMPNLGLVDRCHQFIKSQECRA